MKLQIQNSGNPDDSTQMHTHITANKMAEISLLDDYANNKNTHRIGMLVLFIGLVGFLGWAAFAPLDEGVPTEGIVNIETNHRAVQHLTGGIVRKILVKENQLVNVGDILVELDNTATKARYEEIKQRYMGLRAQESRLMAEKTGAQTIQFHADLLNMQADVFIGQHMLNQSQLLQARQQALFADIAALNASIQGQNAQIDGYQGLLSSYQLQFSLLNDQLENIKPLVKEGFAPRNQQNELEQKLAQTAGQVANTQAAILQCKKTILELNARMNSRTQTEKKDINTQMAQVKFEVQSDAEKFKALGEELQRTTIVAPATGQVAGLQIHTVGAVVQPGQKIMDIVPAGAPLILDAKIPPHLIDKVHAGQMADVRFSTFANAPQLLIEGKVDSISSDLLTETAPSQNQAASNYYLARVAITPAGLQALGSRQLQPGMPVQIVINTGERTLLTYLLHPLSKRIAASMKEE